MTKALEGVVVIDLTSFMSGPFASMVLGDLGAEVIKIEEPGIGDSSRQIPPYFHEGESMYYISLNRNKKSVTLNLKTEKGRAILLELVKKADILIENYRPRITRKLGIDYETVKNLNPRIIYCSLTGYGPEGPYGDRPSYDLNIQALSGAMSMTGEEDTGPLRLGVPMGDLAGSMWSLIGTLSALRHRDKTGEGQHVNISLLDALTALIIYPALYYSYGGEIAKPLGSGHQAIVPFGAFKAADGYVTIVCPTQKFWCLLCQAVGMADLIKDPRFVENTDRLRNKKELNALLSDAFSNKTVAVWADILGQAGIPFSQVNTIDKVFEDPGLQYQNMIISVDHFGLPLRFFGNPVKMSKTPVEEYRTPPKLGADNEEVFKKYLGLSSDDIAQLSKEEILKKAKNNDPERRQEIHD